MHADSSQEPSSKKQLRWSGDACSHANVLWTLGLVLATLKEARMEPADKNLNKINNGQNQLSKTMQLKLIIIGTFLATPLLLGQTNQPQHASQSPQNEAAQALQKLEQRWANAVKHQDVETINQIQADDYEFIGPAGEVWTKNRALDFIKAGNLEITSFELSEFKVRVYGDTAVVNFRVVWNGSSGGNDISGPQRMTDVFVKRDGRWQCVASQTTRIVPRP